MRINKFISETGFCSRREADKLVEAGRVTINDVLAKLGSQAEQGDRVYVDGTPIVKAKPYVYLALNKPAGITCTTERHIEGNIIDFIHHSERIFPIGRLDKDSEGLILLTSDGDIVNKILRAEHHHEKEYVVTVDKQINPEFLARMASGVFILGSMTLPSQVDLMKERTFRIILTEGRNRQIRRMCSELGYTVKHLKRVRVMNIKLEGIRSGEWRDLTDSELQGLFHQLEYHPSIK